VYDFTPESSGGHQHQHQHYYSLPRGLDHISLGVLAGIPSEELQALYSQGYSFETKRAFVPQTYGLLASRSPPLTASGRIPTSSSSVSVAATTVTVTVDNSICALVCIPTASESELREALRGCLDRITSAPILGNRGEDEAEDEGVHGDKGSPTGAESQSQSGTALLVRTSVVDGLDVGQIKTLFDFKVRNRGEPFKILRERLIASAKSSNTERGKDSKGKGKLSGKRASLICMQLAIPHDALEKHKRSQSSNASAVSAATELDLALASLLGLPEVSHSEYFACVGDEVDEKCKLVFESWVEKT
jgi:hypothetical protein